MYFVFFDAKDVVHHEFLLEKQIVNDKFYKEMMKRVIARVHHVRSKFKESECWFLLHDNTPAHSSIIVSKFLAKREIPGLAHSFYLSDFSVDRLFLFLKLKIAMKGNEIWRCVKKLFIPYAIDSKSDLEKRCNELLHVF